jgi:hypothetical protein
MTGREPRRADVDLDDDEELISLARISYKRRYRQEIDSDPVYADLRGRIAGQAPPPQSSLRRWRSVITQAWRQMPRDWRAPLKTPWAITLIAGATAIAIIALLVSRPHELSVLRNQGTTQAAGRSDSSSKSSSIPVKRRPAAGAATAKVGGGDTDGKGLRGAGERLVRSPVRRSPDKRPLTIDITVGGESGALISLDATLSVPVAGRPQLQAHAAVAVDPASAATCSVTHIGNGGRSISQLLAELKTPILVKVQAGSAHPAVVQLYPTGSPTQPLGCSMANSGTRSATSAATAGPTSLVGAVGNLLGSLGSLSSRHSQRSAEPILKSG